MKIRTNSQGFACFLFAAHLFCGYPHISDRVTHTGRHGNASAEFSITFPLVILPYGRHWRL